MSVPVVRHLAEDALLEVGAHASDAHDVELALAEACANVLTHAGPGDVYDVELVIGPYNCVIRVVDVGAGFDADATCPGCRGSDAESGRGHGPHERGDGPGAPHVGARPRHRRAAGQELHFHETMPAAA